MIPEEIAATVLDPHAPDEAVSEACERAYAALAARVPFAAPKQLDCGLALSPMDAAHCLRDARRTAAFARALLHAIQSLQTPVEVVYAGTGPLAPFAWLVMPFVRDVRFTLIDIHESAVAAVRALLPHANAVCADAARYRHDRPIDIAITETMQRALAREPFVEIVRNLKPQLSARGVLIPERVSVELAAGESATTIFSIDAQSETNGATIAIARGVTPALQTRIVAGSGEVLEPYDSGLTHPEILWNLAPGTYGFRYETGPHPSIRSTPQ